MKGYKKILSSLLMVIILFSNTQTLYAMPGVDTSRIKLSISKLDVELRFGSVSIWGVAKLVNPFTDAEVDQLAKEVLKDMGITQLELQEANKKVDKARKATEFTKEDVERVKQNIFTSMNVVPGMGDIPSGGDVANLLDFINQAMNSNSWDDIGTLSVDKLEGGMSDKVKDTAKGMVNEYGELGEEYVKKYEWIGQLSSIITFAEMIDDEHTRDREKWKSIAEGAEAKRLLNQFYEKLQTKVESYIEKSNKKGWVIDFNNKEGKRNFNFFNTSVNKQTWTLDMGLKQQVTDELGSVAGIYEGNFTLKTTHKMDEFVKGLDTAARSMEPIKQMLKAFEPYKKDITPLLRTKGTGSATIERIQNGKCKVEVRKDGTALIDMTTTDDDKQIDFSDLSVDLELLLTNKDIGSVVNLSFPLNVTNDKENVQIQILSLSVADLVDNATIAETFENDKELIDVGWDSAIWDPWDSNEKELYLFK